MGQNQLNEAPTPNHMHGRIDDHNSRLARMQLKVEAILDELRGPLEMAESKPKSISSGIMEKISAQSDLITEIDNRITDIINIVGSDTHKMKASVGTSRA